MHGRRIAAGAICATMLVVAHVFAQQPAPTLTGRAVEARSTCCGGAARPAGAVCASESAWSGELTVRSGRRNRGRVVERVRVTAGDFRAALPPGTYCLAEAAKSAGRGGALAAGSASHDADCTARWRATCDAVVTVPGRATVRLDRGCFGPCYRGPMPP
jgi:hypothetical protein